jgi:hypothetical protein
MVDEVSMVDAISSRPLVVPHLDFLKTSHRRISESAQPPNLTETRLTGSSP